MLVNWSEVKLPTILPIALKASLLGAKMVRSGVSTTESVRLAVLMAPSAAVRLALDSVSVTFSGITRRLLMTWMVPPVKFTFYNLVSDRCSLLYMRMCLQQ